MSMYSLDDQVALVTGGSRGIGFAIAAEFRSAGAHVVICARKAEGVRDAVARLQTRAGAGRVLGLVANAGDPEAAEQTVAAAMAEFGRLDVLVNNAATNPYMGPLIDIDVARAEKTVQVNQYGMLVWTRYAVSAWMRDNGGSVINIASVGGMVVDPGIGYYNATKAAMLLMTRQLAYELGPSVRVNSIAPGVIRTELARKVWEPREKVLNRTLPMRRLGEVEDVGRAALFLATEASSWITGQTLVVDGGMLASPNAVDPTG